MVLEPPPETKKVLRSLPAFASFLGLAVAGGIVGRQWDRELVVAQTMRPVTSNVTLRRCMTREGDITRFQ